MIAHLLNWESHSIKGPSMFIHLMGYRWPEVF